MKKLGKETCCPMEITVQILANKWSIPIIRQLMEGPLRPSDLERNLKGLSAKTLAERLHDLKEWNIVSRHSFPEVPPRVEYSLTPLGKELQRVLDTLADYGKFWQEKVESKDSNGDGEKSNIGAVSVPEGGYNLRNEMITESPISA